MMKRIQSAILAAALCCSGAAHAATNLVQNGGFETGNLTGWTCSVGADRCAADTSNGTPNSGSFYLELFENSGASSVSQTISTNVGQTYNFSFFAMTTGPELTENLLSYSLNGGAATFVTRESTPTEFTDSFVATLDTASITFFFETVSGGGLWAVDDVSVFAAAPVPLPASAPLLMAALGGLWWRRARHKA